MKKIATIALACVSLLTAGLLGGCKAPEGANGGGGDTGGGGGGGSTVHTKPLAGIPPIFDDGVNYYETSPTMIVDGNNAYVYYTTNKTSNKTDSVIAVKKGTKQNGAWKFGDRKILVESTKGAWDAGMVSDPDVVKGNFAYEGHTYSYLLVYQGAVDNTDKCYSIGIALGDTPDGEFVKVDEPILKYDIATYGVFWGIGQPSVVSYDDSGKVYLMYTRGEELMTASYISEVDFSNCEDIKGLDAASMLPQTGLKDSTASTTLVNNLGFAKKNGYFYAVRDFNPVATAKPNVTQAVQVAKINISDVYSLSSDPVWTLLEERVNFLDLGNADYNGWERVYSGSVVKDFYGNVVLGEENKVELTATVTTFDMVTREYQFRQCIIKYGVNDK